MLHKLRNTQVDHRRLTCLFRHYYHMTISELDLKDKESIPSCTVADPGFPRRGRQPQKRYNKLLFGKIFVKNSMKVLEIGPGACP